MIQPADTKHGLPNGPAERGWPSHHKLGMLLLGLFLALPPFFWPNISLAQIDPTSTPDPEGNIYYIVQPNDSLWSIAARSGITLQELLDLNDMVEDSVVNPGDQLLLDHVDPPPTATSDVPTPTRPPPTASETPPPPRTAICMAAFDDLNRDGQHDVGESLLAGVAFTVFNDQIVVANYITDGISEPHCLEALEAGTYHVTRSKAPDEVLTTQGDWALNLFAGSELNLAFGSYLQEDSLDQAGSLDLEAQLATSTIETPAAAAVEVAQHNDRTIAGIPLMIVLLGIGIFALLLAVAVLLFWFAYKRHSET